MLPIKLTLDTDFYKEEIRCDYTISSEMKQIWAIELDLLNEFINMCEAYHLSYYAIGGTLLGTARHSGFIPWDDDIDIAMPRKDYEQMCLVASAAFKYPYFLQTEESDCGFCRTFARLRNSETTAIPEYEVLNKLPVNQGIWIDIFPLDNIPDDSEEKNSWIYQFSKVHRKLWASLRMTTRYKTGFEKENLVKMTRFIYGPIVKSVVEKFKIHNRDYYRLDELFQKYKSEETKQWGLLWFYKKNEWTFWNKSDFAETSLLPFETLKIKVPKNYDNVLTKQYGNWHVFVRGNAVHKGTIFDPGRSYKYYMKNPDELLDK